jgi:hypothetical protein
MIWFQRIMSGALYVAALSMLYGAQTTLDFILVALMVGFASLSAGLSALIDGQRVMLAQVAAGRERQASAPVEPEQAAKYDAPRTEGGFICGECRRALWLPEGKCPQCGSRSRIPAR